MTRKTMTLAEQMILAKSIQQQRQAERERKLARGLATGEAIRRPCGHVVMQAHGMDDLPDGPYYEPCACDSGVAQIRIVLETEEPGAFADSIRVSRQVIARGADVPAVLAALQDAASKPDWEAMDLFKGVREGWPVQDPWAR